MTRRERKIFIAPIVVALLFLGVYAYQKHRFASADRGFRAVTGRNLPANVAAMSHSTQVTDHFFRSSHFWLLQGPHASLHELAPTPDFERSDDDAKQWLPQAGNALALPDAEIVEGYEGGNVTGGGRDRWLLILPPGDRAVFIY